MCNSTSFPSSTTNDKVNDLPSLWAVWHLFWHYVDETATVHPSNQSLNDVVSITFKSFVVTGRQQKLVQRNTRWLYCVECPQYSIWHKALAVYFLHSTRPSVTWLNSQLSLAACDWLMTSSGHGHLRQRFRQTASNIAENLGEVSCTVKMETRHPVQGSFGNEFPSINDHCGVIAAWSHKMLKNFWFFWAYFNDPYGNFFFKILCQKDSTLHRSTCCVQILEIYWWKSVKLCIRCTLKSEYNIRLKPSFEPNRVYRTTLPLHILQLQTSDSKAVGNWQRWQKSEGCGKILLCTFYSEPQCSRCNASIASAVLAIAIPSVCPSVTRPYCVKRTACSTVQFALLDSKMCLVL